MNIHQERVWKVAGLVGIVLAIYLIALAIGQFKAIGYIGTSEQSPNTISVTGTGDAYAKPDVALFTFTLSDTEKAVADAQAKVATEEHAALQIVSAAGVADADVTTQSYSINPHYDYQNALCPQTASYDSSASVPVSSSVIYCPPNKQTLTGYDVNESIQVKLRDLTKAGSLLSSLGGAGVQDLNGPSFSVDDPDSVQAQARTIAIADAKSKAQALAQELGVSLVGITSFSEDNGNIGPIMYAMGSAAVPSAALAPAPQVPAGQQKVTSNVTITYEIR